jgi:MYXO-CTERM domain-containing protein
MFRRRRIRAARCACATQPGDARARHRNVYLMLAILGALLAIAAVLPPFAAAGTTPPGFLLGLVLERRRR